MNSTAQIAVSIPHEIREKILLQWLHDATPSMQSESMRNLFDAWFIYVDPNGVKKENCPKCVLNVFENWRSMQQDLVEAEREYNLLNEL